jgi:hypothetical protein
MSQVIRVSDEIFARLENHAVGFDTPESVIERMLNQYEGVEVSTAKPFAVKSMPARDMTKYAFNNHDYGKGRLVLAVVRQYVADNRGISFDQLLEVFPKKLQGSIGVFSDHDEVVKIYSRKNHKRHFFKTEDLIQLSNRQIAVCTEWGIGNISQFIQVAQSLSYEISGS